jgi:hypothetical protein
MTIKFIADKIGYLQYHATSLATSCFSLETQRPEAQAARAWSHGAKGLL